MDARRSRRISTAVSTVVDNLLRRMHQKVNHHLETSAKRAVLSHNKLTVPANFQLDAYTSYTVLAAVA